MEGSFFERHNMATDKRLLTLGIVAERAGVPIHKVQYYVRSRGIEPSARAGNLRVFDAGLVERVRRELVASQRAE